MSADADFVRTLTRAIRDQGGRIIYAPDPDDAPNPFLLRFETDGESYGALIHCATRTPQRGVDTDHARPEGEWHTQMIFDHSERGAGVRNRLRAGPDQQTPAVLFGFASINGGTVVVAWDSVRHEEHGYSTSLQVREGTLTSGRNSGVSRQSRTTGEIIVAFRPEHLPYYLKNRSIWHETVEPPQEDRAEADYEPIEAPLDEPGVRRVRTVSLAQTLRDIRFRTFIHRNYERCAVCGLSARACLEAAHIVPVSHPSGTDHFSNGLLLCRNCHSLFDAGLLLIHPDYRVELSDAFDAEATEDAERIRRDAGAVLILPDIPPGFLPDPEKLREALTLRH